MIIEKILILKGPNVWSIRRSNLIQMRLNLEELEEFPTNKINGFYERIIQLIPSLYTHRCSEGVEGGFFTRVKEGTWMGHVIEHIALEIQTLAGMFTGFGRTRSTSIKGVYNVVFNYVDEEAGKNAAEFAVEIAQALINGDTIEIQPYIDKMHTIYEKNKLGPSTQSIVDAAEARHIPWRRLNKESSFIYFGQGIHQKFIQATITCQTSYHGVQLAGDKDRTKQLLNQYHIPIPKGGVAITGEEVYDLVKQLGFPLVIKPLNGNQGKGATVNICDLEDVDNAFLQAKEYGNEVIVERYIEGKDYRIMVVNHKVVALAEREPAHIVGDGVHTINQLIQFENTNPLRGEGHINFLTKLLIDDDLLQMLSKQKYDLESIPLENEKVILKSTCNLSTGGTSTNVTSIVHPSTILMAEKISRIIGLDVCGIDVIAHDISLPFTHGNGAVLEVNAAPGFRMHTHPAHGEPIDIGKSVINYLYPQNIPTNIPIIAVTGTNGKTTTTRLIAHILQQSGKQIGYTTTDGIYLNKLLLERGDTTGPRSARKVLQDPMTEIAVLETARGGILREGIGFKECQIGVLTNIEEDHLGLNDINTLEDLARVKSVVLDTIQPNGWAIINAENAISMKISKKLSCHSAYFISNPQSELIPEFIKRGEKFSFIQDDIVCIYTGQKIIKIIPVQDVPITYGGKAQFMIQNMLAAALACYLLPSEIGQIKQGLETFQPGVEQTPGRLNIFEINDFKLLVDYAHNPSGYLAIQSFIESFQCNRKIGIISGIGDRRDQDIVQCASIAAQMFDYIIIRQEHHLRGRSEKEITSLLLKGIQQVNPAMPVKLISDEVEALKYALQIAEKGDFVIALSDEITNVIQCIKRQFNGEINIV